MKRNREKPPLILWRTQRGLEARSRQAADILAVYPLNEAVEVTVRRRRSPERLAAYWAGLSRLVEATECYPSAEHLHDGIKMDLGYTTPVRSLTGAITYVPDSVAISAMDEPAFVAFFDRVRKRIIEVYGVDPWSEEARDAA
jgi:hypothetical protein